MANAPPTLVLLHKGGGDEEGGSVVPTSEWRRVTEGEISSLRSVQALPSGTASPRNDSSVLTFPVKNGILDSQGNPATTGVIALHAQGPSSLSVTIEDEKGNVIMVSRVEDTESTSTSTSDLMVTDESDRLVLTW